MDSCFRRNEGSAVTGLSGAIESLDSSTPLRSARNDMGGLADAFSLVICDAAVDDVDAVVLAVLHG